MEQMNTKTFLNKILILVIATLLFVCVFNGVIGSDKNVYAAEPTILYSGTSGTCSWSIDDTGLLRIYPTDGVSGTLVRTSSWGWSGYKSSVTKIIIDDGVIACSDLGSLFNGFSSCTEMDLSGLDTSNATYFGWMFANCSSLTELNLSNFNTSKVENMTYMFSSCIGLTELDLSNFDTSNAINLGCMFYKCSGLKNINMSNFNTEKVTNMSYMFYSCSNLLALDVSNFNTSNVTTMSSMFNGCKSLPNLDVSNFNTSKVTDFSWMFSGYSASNLDISNFDTSNATTIAKMFRGCNNLIELDLSNFDTSKVTYMSEMFSNCKSLTNINISNFDTSNVVDMSYMFYNCVKLTELSVAHFNTSNVTTMEAMFCGCDILSSLDVSNFNTSKVESMNYMFSGCKITSLDLSNFDTSNVTLMAHVFSGCSSLTELDISSFNTAKVTTMQNMFNRCSKLKNIRFGVNFNFIGTNHLFDNTGSDWVKVRKADGKKTYDNTTYTGLQISDLNNMNTTPLLGGLWVKNYQSDDYTTNPDGTVEYISNDLDWVFVSDIIWTYTFTVFDDSLQFKLFEEFMENYISAAMFPSYILVVNKEASITNTSTAAKYGKLKITKRVDGNSFTDDTFEFTIALSGTNISGTKIYNNTVFEDGVGHFVLKANETKTFDLPVGLNYTISEKKYLQYESVVTNATGTIGEETISIVEVVNTYIESPESEDNCVNLTLKKTVSENCNPDKEFFISGYFTNLEPNKEYQLSNGKTFTSNEKGVAYVDVVLSHQNELVFHNLPIGTTYQFTEHENEYVGSVNITDFIAAPDAKIQNVENQVPNVITATTTEALEAGENILVHFHSDTTPLQDLIIVKTVKEELEDGQLVDYVTDEEFEFTITFTNIPSDISFSSDIGKIVGNEYGEATKTFRLKNGESVKFYDIPVGIQYTVTEIPNNYIASYAILGVNVESETYKNTIKKQALSTKVETVDANEDGVVEFININTSSVFSVTIRKVNTDNILLSGAVLRIVDTENNIIEEITTTGEEYVTELEAGSYILQEISAPRGYYVADNIQFEVSADGENIITMVDEEITTLASTGGTGTTVTIVIAIVLGFITVACIYVAKSKAKKLDESEKDN